MTWKHDNIAGSLFDTAVDCCSGQAESKTNPADYPMIINAGELSPNKFYYTVTQTIIPRPIAWILSDNGAEHGAAGRFNLAPFSYFTPVSSQPPLLMFSVGKKPDGSLKDTRQNIIEREYFVVHIPDSTQAQAVTESSASYAFGDSEVERLGMPLTAFGNFPLPRLAGCGIAYGCKLYEAREIGEAPQALIFGLVTHVYIDDRLIAYQDGNAVFSATKIDPLARLGGDEYWVKGSVIRVPRPR